MSIEIKSGDSSTLLTIDATSKAARVSLYDTNGGTLAKQENADLSGSFGIPQVGQMLPGKLAKFSRTDSIGTLRAGGDICFFADPVEGATINTNIWASTVTTMTNTQANNVVTTNANSTLTTTTGGMLTSLAKFPHLPGKLLKLRTRARLSWQQTNAVCEIGFGTPASVTGAAVTDGAFFRITASGVLQQGFAFGSSETMTTIGTLTAGAWLNPDTGNSFNVANFYVFDITIGDDWALFQIYQTSDGELVYEGYSFCGAAASGLFNASHIGVFVRTWNPGTVASVASQTLHTEFSVDMLDGDLGKAYTHIMASLLRGSSTNPTTFVQSANYANSAAPSSATLSNTAAGYTTLGGQWQFAAVGGAETDYALFGFTVPSPYRLYVTGIRIDAFNMGAAVATTAHSLQWSIAHNAAAISLAGTQVRVPLGQMSALTATPIGGSFNQTVQFTPQVPWVTEPNRLFIVILKMPTATATASQIIRGICCIDGYFE